MICLNCKKQISDDSSACSFCGTPIEHKKQLSKEISFRRYQRWVFYVIISLVFIGMIMVIINIYNANNKLLLQVASVEKDLSQKAKDLQDKDETISQKNKIVEEIKKSLSEKEKELEGKTNEFKKITDEKADLVDDYQKCQLGLSSADANIYNLIIKLGEGISNENLSKIPLADSNLNIGDDKDGDGLSDTVEKALLTDPGLSDTDSDGYSDKDEILGGYNPSGLGNLNIDADFASNQIGKLFLQVDSEGEAWYISSDAKRYFLGTPANAFRIMRDLEYWKKMNN